CGRDDPSALPAPDGDGIPPPRIRRCVGVGRPPARPPPPHDSVPRPRSSIQDNGSDASDGGGSRGRLALPPGLGGGGTAAGADGRAGAADRRRADFVGPARAVKFLFSLPYADPGRDVSVAVHNVGGGTLLLDAGDDVAVVEDVGGYEHGAGDRVAGGSGGGAGAVDGGAVGGVGEDFRRGRRRRRPRSWATQKDDDDDDGGDDGNGGGGPTGDGTGVDLDLPPSSRQGSQLARLREGERSLLASLSIMLAEERRRERGEGAEEVDAGVREGNVAWDDGEGDDSGVTVGADNSKDGGGGGGGGGGDADEKAVAARRGDDSHALAVPSNSLVVHQGSLSLPKASAAGSTGTAAASTTAPNFRGDPGDGLSPPLPPPHHYLRNVASPPAEPRQYVDWTFHDMNFVVGSDALIYDQNRSAGGGGGSGDGGAGGEGRGDSVAALLSPSQSTEEAVRSEDVVLLPTCLVPSSGVGPEWARLGFAPAPSSLDADDFDAPVSGLGGGDVGGMGATPSDAATTGPTAPSSAPPPACTVLDAYLDNVMANIPQLALVLREHGFVRNVELLRTEDIPSLMAHPSTLHADGATPRSSSSLPAPEPIFSPDIVEMNAAALLRFLRENCTRENATYLLRRAAGDERIRLFDVGRVSDLRQRRKWTWWLALCSYRFACRLEQVQRRRCRGGAGRGDGHDDADDRAARREYRARQRSLLDNTLNLLEELADMGGGRHDTIGAAVCEHLADTYLWSDDADRTADERQDATKPAPCASTSQPFANVTVDSLNKANDHLAAGIRKLTPLLAKARDEDSPIEIEALSTQLYGLRRKVVNVNLRLADRHLRHYFSSDLIQSLRTTARTLAYATSFLDDVAEDDAEGGGVGSSDAHARSLLLQHAWLWEYAGHFARSFVADDLWRERAHTCGSDLVGLFREIDASCDAVAGRCLGATTAGAATATGAGGRKAKTPSVGAASHGQVSLRSLSGVVVLPSDFERIEASVLQKEGCHEAIGAARSILDQKTQIKRDARLVRVAACVCYGHAIDSYVLLEDARGPSEEDDKGSKGAPRAVRSSLIQEQKSLDVIGWATHAMKLAKSYSRSPGPFSSPTSPPRDKASLASKRFGMSHVSAILLASAQFWFLEGLKQFEAVRDLRNLALLRCNLCQCCKIRANSNVILPGNSVEDSRKNNTEAFLEEAVDHLASAHDAMGERDADPITWDMVSEELAATLLVLGVRRRQSALSSSPEPVMFQALRLTPGVEKSIVETMERSCRIYESLGTPRSASQAAAAHYQLALYFSKVWTCQRDEAKTREKLAAAFKHYGTAHQYFSRHIRGNETTFVILSLDFSSLYAAVPGEECLHKALLCCLDTRDAFDHPLASAAMEQMSTLADNVEMRVSKLLLSLVKIEKGSNPTKGPEPPSERYKLMYRKVLEHKMRPPKTGEANNVDESGETAQPAFAVFHQRRKTS
ncbi:hypothetical protein ACHAWF_007505, partial [Thalassiosira exigua]